MGKIPTMVFDDGRMLSESGAILYLLARDTALFPGDPWEQANELRWMFFEQYSHEPYIAVNGIGNCICPPPSRPGSPIAFSRSRARRARARGHGAAIE